MTVDPFPPYITGYCEAICKTKKAEAKLQHWPEGMLVMHTADGANYMILVSPWFS